MGEVEWRQPKKQKTTKNELKKSQEKGKVCSQLRNFLKRAIYISWRHLKKNGPFNMALHPKGWWGKESVWETAIKVLMLHA